jgi:hypothetical protein
MNTLYRLCTWMIAPDAVPARRATVTDGNGNGDGDGDELVLADGRTVVDRGQATTEYALVLLGAAMIALLVVAWATAGGGAGKIGRLFDRVIDSVLSKVG